MTIFYNKPLKDSFFVFSLFFSGVIINGLGMLSPAYFSIVIVLFTFLLYFQKLQSKYLYSNLVFLLLAAWFFLEFFLNPTGDKKTGSFLIVSSLSYPVFDLLCKSVSKKKLIIYSRNYIKFVVVIYLIELIVRLHRTKFNLLMLFDSSFFLNKFYLLKEDIIIGGGDTNFIATHLLVVFFFCLYLMKRYKIKLRICLLSISFLIFFTFSRASWIALCTGYLILNFIFKNNKLSFTRLLITMTITFVLLITSLYVLLQDTSFRTKMNILRITVNYIKEANYFDFLFGLGFLNSIEVIKDYVAHNLISTLLIDTGLISVVLYFLCWFVILKQSKKNALFILIPIFIFSLSFIQQMIPYLYSCLAIITNLEEKNDFNNCSSLQCRKIP